MTARSAFVPGITLVYGGCDSGIVDYQGISRFWLTALVSIVWGTMGKWQNGVRSQYSRNTPLRALLAPRKSEKIVPRETASGLGRESCQRIGTGKLPADWDGKVELKSHPKVDRNFLPGVVVTREAA